MCTYLSHRQYDKHILSLTQIIGYTAVLSIILNIIIQQVSRINCDFK